MHRKNPTTKAANMFKNRQVLNTRSVAKSICNIPLNICFKPVFMTNSNAAAQKVFEDKSYDLHHTEQGILILLQQSLWDLGLICSNVM